MILYPGNQSQRISSWRNPHKLKFVILNTDTLINHNFMLRLCRYNSNNVLKNILFINKIIFLVSSNIFLTYHLRIKKKCFLEFLVREVSEN